MTKRISPKPASFINETEQDYWHEAQDIAYRAGISLIERDGASWIVTDDGERLICEPSKSLWFETWHVLKAELPKLYRPWVGGFPLPLCKPQELD